MWLRSWRTGGRKVCIITARDAFVPGMGFTNRGNMLKRFFQKNVTISTGIKVKRITPEGLVCEKEGLEFKVCADNVVLSLGMESRNFVEEQLKGYDCEFYRVGDCSRIGNAMTAFSGAYDLAGRI